MHVLGPGLRTFLASASYIVIIVEAKRFCKALVLKYLPLLTIIKRYNSDNIITPTFVIWSFQINDILICILY